ncbi:hypothetical protein [Bacillus thuringiensis]|uniref:hypothetical protein n=1 Tax=Bacillus thuringiensis TaxID=1428 RepID=UPI0011A26EDA|nr:hypothetical protein [Bacillus thuringiensis]
MSGRWIRKEGNWRVRCRVVECGNGLVKGRMGLKWKGVKGREKGEGREVIGYGDEGVERLERKYDGMIYEGKGRNVGVRGIGREVGCFMWGLEVGKIDGK